MAAFTRKGYGQVEPNQLSAQKTGQIYASLPLDPEVKTLQNGEFMYYDYVKGKVTDTPSLATSEPFLVYNEIKLYTDYQHLRDFAMIRVGDNFTTSDPVLTDGFGGGALTKGAEIEHSSGYRMDGIAPRLFKTNIGDIYTTNMVKADVEYAKGDYLTPKKDTSSHTLVLEKEESPTAGTMVWQVGKVYTMPDGQPGLKIQRVQ